MRRRGVASLLVAVASAIAPACGDGDAGSEPDALDAPMAGERTVQVTGAGGVRLSGTLSVADAPTGRAVLIVPSTGAGDRNGVIGLNSRPDGLAADLATTLREAGITSYRYDRRGTGESRLDPSTPLTFDDQVVDARAALDLLAERRETAGRELAVVGYDQGGHVALRLAAADPRVKRLVLISVPGRSVVDVQAAALEGQYGPESAEALRQAVAQLVQTGTVPPPDALRAELRPLLPPEHADYLADLYRRDPAPDAAQVKVPTMIVLPSDPVPYSASRIMIEGAPVQIINSPAGGPSLLVTAPSRADEPSRPVHEHGVGPAPGTTRDVETLRRIAAFLQQS